MIQLLYLFRCGLIAFIEAASIMGFHSDPEKVLRYAVDSKMTKKGEMFSASEMRELASQQLRNSDYKAELVDGLQNVSIKDAIVETVLNALPCIIP